MSYTITYIWNLNKMVQMNLFTTEIDSQMEEKKKTNLQLPGGGGSGKGYCDIVIDICTLLYIK